tara:strand:+ start:1776 stop:3467 length:1692 start_codon:yes stop_codon:yes gene_type:complete
MAATLDDIKKELIANRKVTDDILKTNSALVSEMTEYFKDLKEAARQNLLNQKENKREAKTTKPGAFGKAFAAQQPKGKGLFGIPGLGVLQALLGSLGAVGAALAGLRGWEKSALKNISGITKTIGMLFPKSVGNSIQNSFLKLRKALLTSVGLDATLKKFGDPKSGLKTSIGAQIFARFEKFKGRLLNSIGLGVDGKPIVVKGDQGLRVPVLSRITGALNKIFEPAIKISDGIFDYFKSSRGVVGFLRTLGFVGGGAAALAGGVVGKAARVGGPIVSLMGKILLPLGILFSAKDAFEAWTSNADKSFLQRFSIASFAFLGDFIGAPLDLLKKGISIIFEKGFGIQRDINGEIIGDGFKDKVARFLEGFSFEKTLKAIPNAVLKVFDSVLEFFNDPIGISRNILSDVVGGIKNLLLFAIRGIISTIPNVPKAVLDLFLTDEERLAKNLKDQENLKFELDKTANKIANFQTADQIGSTYAGGSNVDMGVGAKLVDNKDFQNIVTRQTELNEQLINLQRDNMELLQKINQGGATSVVNAPTNNINNVSQGINYSFPGAITNALIYR